MDVKPKLILAIAGAVAVTAGVGSATAFSGQATTTEASTTATAAPTDTATQTSPTATEETTEETMPEAPPADCPESPDPPLGAPFDSSNDQNQVVLAGTPVGGTGVSLSDINLVAIDRENRHVDYARGNFTNDDAGVATLATEATAVGKAHPSDLIVISGRAGLTTKTAVDAFAKVTATIGGELSKHEHDDGLSAHHPFSFVGVPGGKAGTAFQNVVSHASLSETSLKGYLQVFTRTCQYGFVTPDHFTFETNAATPPGTTEVRYRGLRFVHQLPNDGKGNAGFHVVRLEVGRRSESTVTNDAVFAVNTGDRVKDRAAPINLRDDLSLAGPDALVFIQSWGNPRPTTPVWGEVARQIERLGGSASVFNRVDGSGAFAFVGGQPRDPHDQSSVELNQVLLRQHSPLKPEQVPGSLAGGITRSRQFDLEPQQGATGDPSASIGAIEFERASPWPSLDTPAEKKAVAYVTAQLDLPAGDDFRRNYWARNVEWGPLGRRLAGLPYVSTPDFAAGDLKKVQETLGKEIDDVEQVKGFIRRLQQPTKDQAFESWIDLSEIGRKVRDAVGPPDEPHNHLLAIVTVFLGVSSEFLSEKVAIAASITAQALSLTGELTGKNGSSVLDDEISVRSTELTHALLERIKDAVSGEYNLGRVLVSDWGKLRAASHQITAGPWNLPDPAGIQDALQIGVKRWFYSELLPLKYRMWDLTHAANARVWSCHHEALSRLRPAYSVHPFNKEPDTGQYPLLLGFTEQMVPDVIFRAVSINALQPYNMGKEDGDAKPPPASLTDELFAKTGLGMIPDEFYERNFSRIGPFRLGMPCVKK